MPSEYPKRTRYFPFKHQKWHFSGTSRLWSRALDQGLGPPLCSDAFQSCKVLSRRYYLRHVWKRNAVRQAGIDRWNREHSWGNLSHLRLLWPPPRHPLLQVEVVGAPLLPHGTAAPVPLLCYAERSMPGIGQSFPLLALLLLNLLLLRCEVGSIHAHSNHVRRQHISQEYLTGRGIESAC